MRDTQEIRNAYMQRPVEAIDVGFGEFACNYLGVKDLWLQREQNLNAACNYILVRNYLNGANQAPFTRD